jgi:hypothetical protein
MVWAMENLNSGLNLAAMAGVPAMLITDLE